MRYGHLFCPFRPACAGRDFMDGMEDVRAVVAVSAGVAHADGDIFHDDKARLVLEGLALDQAGAHHAAAVFTLIAVL